MPPESAGAEAHFRALESLYALFTADEVRDAA
jgi:hypothetical protein